jgi:hypothetical protein
VIAWAHVATIVEPAALRDLVIARARHVLERFVTTSADGG